MTWGAVATVAVGVISSSMQDDGGGGGGGGGGGAPQITQEQRDLYKAQAEQAAKLTQISDEQWNNFKTLVLPKIAALTEKINPAGSEEQAIGEAVGDVKGQYAVGRENLKRDMELSRNPADPAYGMSLAQLSSLESGDVGGAITKARNTNRESVWNKSLQQLAAYGDPGGAAASAAGAAGTLLGGASSNAGTAARNALLSRSINNAQASQTGYGLGNLAQKAITAYNAPGTGYTPGATGGYVQPANSYDYGDAAAWGAGSFGGQEIVPNVAQAFDYTGMGFKEGGKVQKVMHEFKHGALHSGSPHGPLVTNRKQAIAIALSEARRARGMADGGPVPPRTKLAPEHEQHFRQWYGARANALGLHPDPDHPEHRYDYRGAYHMGADPDQTGHWPSEFKDEDHPNRYVNGVDTRTGQPVRAEDAEMAEGGPVDGPGTGTSDSVSAIKVPGTYILSADTVRALGHDKLYKTMEKAGVRPGEGESPDKQGISVKLSNGEWAMPPAVVQHYGEEFFHKMQQKYHKPIHGADDAMANGGPVRHAIKTRELPQEVEDAILRAIPAKAIGRK